MTPRRSSRARTSQPSPALLQHTNSSSSSNSLTRERSTRSNNKISSPQRSSTQRSQSVDDTDAASKTDLPHTRQRQRTRGEDDNDRLGEGEEDDPEEDDEEEEEVTRCLCGQQDYPGLPPSRREALGRNGVHPRIKDESALALSADSSDLLSDDIGSMFIQCDSCKVWQHGGCVGIMDEAMSPDEYYCEECRKDLHRIRSEPNGQHSSQYLPVAPPSAVSSRASSRDDSKRVKDPKSRSNDPIPKRRSTMNSRDAAYDEEELIRRAIEESKEDTKSTTDEIAIRRGKRSRSDSEAHRQTTKRQRTSSPSPGATPKPSNPVSQPVSEDEAKAKAAATNGVRRPRAASRSQRDKDTKEPEEPETEQSETNRKKSKTEKRKSGDAESDHETESPSKPVPNDPEPPQPNSDTPAPIPEPAPSRPSTRKSGRPPARRGGRVGRNQYTRDRDANINGGDSSMMANSPRRGQSHDTGGDSPRIGGPNGTHVNGGDTGKPSRPRYVNQRTTMNEMKRRVAGILEFISRMQVEMAAAGESSTSPPSNGDRPNGILLKAVSEQLESAALSTASDADAATTDGELGAVQPPSIEKDFKGLSSVEMMDVLTRHLLKWQQEYGKFGER